MKTALRLRQTHFAFRSLRSTSGISKFWRLDRFMRRRRGCRASSTSNEAKARFGEQRFGSDP
jgi:hypothetical protein